MAAPRRICGQNISSKIGSDRLAGAEPEAERKEREAEGGQEPAVEPPLQHHRDRRRHQLRDTGDKHDLADLECAIPPHIGQENRHQIDRSVEPDAEDEAQHRPQREVAIGEQSEVDERLL